MEQLTMKVAMSLRDGMQANAGEPIVWDVVGNSPTGETATIHRTGGHRRFRWRIVTAKDGVPTTWPHEYLSAQDALEGANHLLNSDELVQDVINTWGMHSRAGNAPTFTPEFKSLVDSACEHRNVKRLADNHREFNILTEEVQAREEMTRELFARAYRAACPIKGTQ